MISATTTRSAVHTPVDATMPDLHLLFDIEVMREWLPEDSEWRVSYVRYKPGASCIVLYEGDTPNGPRWAYAKAFAISRDDGRDEVPGWRYIAKHRFGIARFPFDRGMPALALACDPALRSESLDLLVDHNKRDRFREDWGRWTPLRYKPERRCVMSGLYRRDNESKRRRFFARFYNRGEGGGIAERYRLLHELCRGRALDVEVPRPLMRRRKHRMVFTKDTCGEPLTDFLQAPDAEERVREAGRALAAFHGLPPVCDVPADDPAEGVFESARAVESLLGANTFGVSELAAAVSPRFTAGRATLTHGDFYHDQLTITPGGRIHIVDLDELAFGDPVSDVANFCAHLLVMDLEGRLDGDEARRLNDAFVDAYAEAAQSDPGEGYSAYMAASILKLAVRPFRTFQPDWPTQVERIVDLAREASAC